MLQEVFYAFGDSGFCLKTKTQLENWYDKTNYFETENEAMKIINKELNHYKSIFLVSLFKIPYNPACFGHFKNINGYAYVSTKSNKVVEFSADVAKLEDAQS